MIAGTLEIQMMANLARLSNDMNDAKRYVSGAMDSINKAVSQAKGALEALGVGLGVGFFVNLIKGSIDAADHLNDLTKSTNLTVEELSGLSVLAKQSGTDIDGLAKAVNKMSVEIGKDPDKFRKLGITAKDNLGALKQFSDIFNLLPDINQRNALAQAIFNKSWAEMAPVLAEGSKKIAEAVAKGAQLAGTTAEMAKQADEFNDNLQLFHATSESVWTTLAAKLLPAFNEISKAVLQAAKDGGVLTAVWVAMGGAMEHILGLDEVSKAKVRLEEVNKQLSVLQKQLASGSMNPKGASSSMFGFLIPDVKLNSAAIATLQNHLDKLNAEKLSLDNIISPVRQVGDASMAAAKGTDAATKAASAAAKAFLENDQAVAAAKKELESYSNLLASIRSKANENALQASLGQDATDSEKMRIKLDQDLLAGTLKLTAAHKARILVELDALAVSEKTLQQQKLQKEITEYIEQGTLARKESNAELASEYALFGQSNDARDIALIAIKAQTAAEAEINKLKKDGYTLTQAQIDQLNEEAQARAKVEQATLAQTKALDYAQQLHEENKRFAADSIIDEKDRARALLEIDAQTWQERIKLAGDGTEAQRVLQQEYQVWYANQVNKTFIDDWRNTVAKYDDIFTRGFADMVNGGTGTWKSFTKSLVTTFKTTVADELYKAFAKPFVIKIVGALLGLTGTGSAVASTTAAGAISSAVGSVGSVASSGGGIDTLFSGGKLLDGITNGFNSLQAGLQSSIEHLGAFLSTGTGGLGDTIGGALGQYSAQISNVLPYAGAAFSLLKGDFKGAAIQGVATAIGSFTPLGPIGGAIIGSLVSGLFGGGGHKETHAYANTSINGASVSTLDSFISKGRGGGAGGYDLGIQAGQSLGSSLNNISNALGAKIVQAFTIGTGYLSKHNTYAVTVGRPIGSYRNSDLSFAAGDSANGTAETFFLAIQKGLIKLPDLLQNIVNRSSISLGNASGALQALSAYQQLNASLKDLPPVFNAVGNSIKLFATTGNLAAIKARFTATSTFTDLFYSDAEKLATLKKQLTTSVGSIGLSLANNRDQYRQQVEAINTTTAAGLRQYDALIALAPAMDAYFNNLQSQADQTASAVDETTASLKNMAGELSSDKFRAGIDYRRAQSYIRNGITEDRIPAILANQTELKDALVAMQNSLNISATSSRKTADLLTQVTQDGRALQTTPAT